MDDLRRFLATGSCCAEALVRLGLQLCGEENEPFANASAALCNGLWSRMTCGALSGGAMLLAMFDKRKACEEMIPELIDAVGEKCLALLREYGLYQEDTL